MESANFISWFKKLFLKNVEHLLCDGPVILFVDGHHSHIDLELIHLAREHNVHLMCLPPNLTHIMQPLDVSVFHPLKQAYTKILKEYKIDTLASNISKAVFPTLLSKLWDISFKPSHLCAGFKTTGIHPLDRKAISDERLRTGIPFRKSTEYQPTSSMSTASTSASRISTMSATSSPLILKGKCKQCGTELTPMRAHITLHFTKVLQQKKYNISHQRKKRVKLTCHGEALTSDEIVARLESQAAEKNGSKSLATQDSSEDAFSSHDEGIDTVTSACTCKMITLKLLIPYNSNPGLKPKVPYLPC